MADKTILFLASDQQSLDILKKNIFEPAGYRVLFCDSRQKAEITVQDEKVDIIILEKRIKGLDSLEIAASLIKRYPAIPLILLAPQTEDPDIVLKALRIGATDCIISPFSQELLLDSIQNGLRRADVWKTWARAQTREHLKTLQERINEMETLAKMGQSVTSYLDLDQVLSAVVKSTVELTGAEEGTLLLLDDESGDLYMRASLNFRDEFVRTFRLPIKDTLAGQVIQTGKPFIFDKETPEKIKTNYMVLSLVYVPLLIKERVIGVLGVDNRTNNTPFKHYHVELMSAMANYAAIAIENARLYTHTQVERNKLETILTNVGDGVIVVNSEGKLVLINPSAIAYLGLNGKEYINKPVHQIIQNEELVRALQGESLISKQRIEISTDTGQTFLTTITPIPEVGRTATFQDITHLKDLDRLKSDFVQTVSHDLRSPLTAILGYVELIERAGNINKRQKEYIRRVYVSLNNISNLINNLLDLGRIEAGFDTQKELVPIRVIIKHASDGLKHLIEEKKQTLLLDIPEDLPLVYGNPVRLRQMFNNLLENAYKYTLSGGHIVVSATTEAEQILIQITDNGIGIPTADQPYVFDKLYRARNATSEVSGSGLGLSIVRSIIENHGGRYWFDSTIDQGTTFTVVLPVAGG